MMKRWLPALALVLTLAGTSEAQISFGIGRGGYWGGRGLGFSIGSGYYAPGYYGYGYTPSYTWGFQPYYGRTWYPSTYTYGSSYYPSYYSYYPGYTSYAPSYSYSTWNTPDYYGYGNTLMSPTYALEGSSLNTYQSFYPSNAPMPEGTSGNASAWVDVRVPTGAAVFFEGEKTQQMGPFRSFVSPPLETGHDYTYQVEAKWFDQNGKVVDQKKTIHVRPGQRTMVDFMTGSEQGQDLSRPGSTRTDTDINRTDTDRNRSTTPPTPRPGTTDTNRPGTTDTNRPGGTTDTNRPANNRPPESGGNTRPPQ